MRTIQLGDRVQVHYVVLFQEGGATSSRKCDRGLLQLTVGVDHPRLPRLGLSLLGLTAGEHLCLHVPAERAYGISDPAHVHRWSRKRFSSKRTLHVGKRLRLTDRRGRRRWVRVLEVSDRVVVFDANPRQAGQALAVEIELLAIEAAGGRSEVPDPRGAPVPVPSSGEPGDEPSAAAWPLRHGRLSGRGRVIAFDPDLSSLASLREALPGWQIDVISGATADSLPCDWEPGAADLLVIRVLDDRAEALNLCRFLAVFAPPSDGSGHETVAPFGQDTNHGGRVLRVNIPLLILMPSEQRAFVRAALEAGALGCLMLPVKAAQVIDLLEHARTGNRQGAHTLDLDQADREERWQDDGGPG
jgi:peptidylprolyl isomerase